MTSTDVTEAINALAESEEVIAQGIATALSNQAQYRECHQRYNELMQQPEDGSEAQDQEADRRQMIEENRNRYLSMLPSATAELLTDEVVCYLFYANNDEQQELDAWMCHTRERGGPYRPT